MWFVILDFFLDYFSGLAEFSTEEITTRVKKLLKGKVKSVFKLNEIKRLTGYNLVKHLKDNTTLDFQKALYKHIKRYRKKFDPQSIFDNFINNNIPLKRRFDSVKQRQGRLLLSIVRKAERLERTQLLKSFKDKKRNENRALREFILEFKKFGKRIINQEKFEIEKEKVIKKAEHLIKSLERMKNETNQEWQKNSKELEKVFAAYDKLQRYKVRASNLYSKRTNRFKSMVQVKYAIRIQNDIFLRTQEEEITDLINDLKLFIINI